MPKYKISIDTQVWLQCDAPAFDCISKSYDNHSYIYVRTQLRVGVWLGAAIIVHELLDKQIIGL